MSDRNPVQARALAILATNVDGLITSFNKASECLLGYGAVEVVGRLRVVTLHDPEELKERIATGRADRNTWGADEFHVIVKDAAPGCTTENDWTYIHRTGRRLPLHLSISAIGDASGDIAGYVWVLQEADHDVATNSVLQQQAELLDLANDAILIRDLERDTITYWNDGAVRLYGWTHKEANGAYIHEFLKTIFPLPLAEIRKTFLAHGYWTGELIHTTRYGRKITVSSRWTLLRNSIRQDGLRTKIMILSMYTNEEYLKEALSAGAAGYLLKDADRNELEVAIKAVCRGETYLTPSMAKFTVEAYCRGEEPPTGPLARLTTRQREILQLIAEGSSTKQIAQRLDLSVKTVETHRAQLMERLEIHDIAGLVRLAIRTGLVQPN